MTEIGRASGDSGPRQPEGRVRRRSIAGVVAKLTAANSVLVLGGFVTGPLQARALGVVGRGEVAAIGSTLGLAPTVASLGLGSYAMWAVARGRATGTVLGTMGALYIALGVVVVALAVPLSSALSGGHPVVREFLLIGLLVLPTSLIGTLLLDVALGHEMWGAVVSTRIVGSLIAVVPVIVLFAAGVLTVSTAAIVVLAVNVTLVIPLVALVRKRPGRLRWHREVAREGVRFGLKAWVGGVSSVTNGRLDQVLMVDLASARQLGLYAVAVSMSTVFLSLVISSLQQAMAPHVARGNTDLVPKMARATVAGSITLAGATAIASPFALRYMFGHSFEAAEPMLLILLVGSLMLALNAILSSAVSSAGHPGVAARAEIYAVLITVPGLLLLLGPLGGVGAAIVSVLAYGFTDVYLVLGVKSRFGGRAGDYVLPRRDDFAFLVAAVRHEWTKRRGRRRVDDPTSDFDDSAL
jgi:O-antigen/teichoic acid export membrane protein